MKLIDCEDFETAFIAVCGSHLNGQSRDHLPQQIDPSDMPARYRDLLVHNDHMTSALASHYGRPVSLRVLQEQQDGDFYSREILLTLDGSDIVVEYGIMRLDLSLVTEAVRSPILARTAPLGDILMQHQVLRRIEPKWFVRFGERSPLLAHFATDAMPPCENELNDPQSHANARLASSRSSSASHDCKTPNEAFGRIGIIHCNHKPAIELLEVVVDGKLRT